MGWREARGTGAAAGSTQPHLLSAQRSRAATPNEDRDAVSEEG